MLLLLPLLHIDFLDPNGTLSQAQPLSRDRWWKRPTRHAYDTQKQSPGYAWCASRGQNNRELWYDQPAGSQKYPRTLPLGDPGFLAGLQSFAPFVLSTSLAPVINWVRSFWLSLDMHTFCVSFGQQYHISSSPV